MITIVNKLKQPLPINLSKGKSLHLMGEGAGRKAEITTEDFNCQELKNHLNKGNILIVKMN